MRLSTLAFMLTVACSTLAVLAVASAAVVLVKIMPNPQVTKLLDINKRQNTLIETISAQRDDAIALAQRCQSFRP